MDPKGSHDWSVVSTPELTNKDMVNFLSHSACIAIQYGSCDAGWIVNTRSQKSCLETQQNPREGMSNWDIWLLQMQFWHRTSISHRGLQTYIGAYTVIRDMKPKA